MVAAADFAGPAAREAVVERLLARFGTQASRSDALREQHSHGENVTDAALPDVVVFPATNEEVAEVARICHGARVPMVPFGAGSSLEGHVAAVHGGVSVDLTRMANVLELDTDALDCRVQAGVTRLRLNDELRSHGLFFPIDPGADATLGGMTATRASGTAAVRYGTMRDAVLGLTVVMADGRVVRTGTRARKTAAGLDLTRLFVGSEGTLGFITEIQLRLWGLPEEVQAAVCQFSDVGSAVQAVIAALQIGVPLARIELLDAVQMQACIEYSRLDEFRPAPTLFIEFHGSAAGVQEQVETMQALASDHGGNGFVWARRPEDRTRLWKARHEVTWANLALRPGYAMIGTDACVPISRLAQCIDESIEDVARAGLAAPLAGHVGDGNFHLGILYDPKLAGERAKAEALAESVAQRAIRLGGTCSGEHGIGRHRIHQLVSEHPEGVHLMRAVKQALDPQGLMNPGKMLPND